MESLIHAGFPDAVGARICFAKPFVNMKVWYWSRPSNTQRAASATCSQRLQSVGNLEFATAPTGDERRPGA
jgi:hypothetical protein